MFVLLVTAEDGAWNQPSFRLDAGRFLEYTDEEVKDRFHSLDGVAQELLLQLPALFAYESGGERGPARVGRLQTIRRTGRVVQISYTFEHGLRPIKADRVERLLAHLGVGKFEMTRTHIALKQGDLLAGLREEGLLGRAEGPNQQQTRRLRGRARRTAELLEELKSLHPKIVKAARSLFASKHYGEAIFAGFKAVEVRVREVGALEGTGQQLMAEAFDEKGPRISVAMEAGQSGQDEQRGFKFLFMGAMVGIRNPKGHGFPKQDDPQRTLEYLAFASLLMRRLDDSLEVAVVGTPRPKAAR